MTEREERAKDWLNRNYGYALELDAIQRRLDKMQSEIEKCVKPIRLREVQEQPQGNGTEEKLATWIDMSADLERKRYILLARDNETIKVIEKIESHILRTILIERYINRLNWNQIKAKLHKDGGWVFELHRQALDAILPYVPEEVEK